MRSINWKQAVQLPVVQDIKLAYKTAKENFAKGGNNRVILCTDGDFNVGESSDDAMERLIENERKSGVFLTVLGYGMGNYQDAKCRSWPIKEMVTMLTSME